MGGCEPQLKMCANAMQCKERKELCCYEPTGLLGWGLLCACACVDWLASLACLVAHRLRNGHVPPSPTTEIGRGVA